MASEIELVAKQKKRTTRSLALSGMFARFTEEKSLRLVIWWGVTGGPLETIFVKTFFQNYCQKNLP